MGQPDDRPRHEDVRNPELPWGYWLLAVGGTSGWPPLEDETGWRWGSPRAALWEGRLDMPAIKDHARDAALEFLLSVLAILDRRIIGTEECARDIFAGNWQGTRFYGQGLCGQRLVAAAPLDGCGLEGPLTPEERAVLRMLAATRPPGEAPLAIGLRWIRARRGLDHGRWREEIAALIERQERFAEMLSFRFVRGAVADRPLLSLVGAPVGPDLPLRRTLWSMSFPDEYARGRMYLWLHEGIDRWQVWSEQAYRHGARSLSEHLLQLRFAHRRAGFADDTGQAVAADAAGR